MSCKFYSQPPLLKIYHYITDTHVLLTVRSKNIYNNRPSFCYMWEMTMGLNDFPGTYNIKIRGSVESPRKSRRFVDCK